MADWGTRDPIRVLGLHRLCSFNIVGRLDRFIRRARRWTCTVVGPIKQWVWAQRSWYSQYPPFSSTRGLCSANRRKILCFRILSMENCRLLMRICSNESVTCDVPMVHSIHLLRFHLYIYGVNPPKSMKLQMDSSSVTQSLFSLL